MTLPPLTRAPRQAKTSERIARELVDYVVTNDLPEGTKLPNEQAMLDVYGVGRTTLREALRLLETQGLLAIRPGRTGGPVVRRPRASDLAEALSTMLRFENASLADVLQARYSIEPTVARFAAERITGDELVLLEESIDRMLKVIDDNRAFLAENELFHSAVAASSGNAALTLFCNTLKTISDGTIVGVEYSVRRRKAIADAHRRIVERLRAHDPDGAEAAMREHLDESGDFWRKRYSAVFEGPLRASTR